MSDSNGAAGEAAGESARPEGAAALRKLGLAAEDPWTASAWLDHVADWIEHITFATHEEPQAVFYDKPGFLTVVYADEAEKVRAGLQRAAALLRELGL